MDSWVIQDGFSVEHFAKMITHVTRLDDKQNGTVCP